jgi:pectate lyase
MKTLFRPLLLLTTAALLLAASCQMGSTTYVSEDTLSAAERAVTGSPVGFGRSVTGGSGSSVTVNSYSALKSAIDGKSASIIYIDGSITMSGRLTIQDRTGLSIIGKNNARLITKDTSKSNSGIFYIKRVNNLKIQNITFEGPGAYDTDGYDNLCLDECVGVWVDHCTFQDGVDGNFDIKNKSDNISVTWCKFEYRKPPIAGGSGGSDDHRYSNLIGSSDSATGDAGKLKVTFYYCHWAEGCKERMPRVRYGQIHILNCLFDSSVNSTSIRAAYKSNVLVEGSNFINQKKPIDLYSGYTAVKASNNVGVSNMTAGSTIFNPGYSYTVDSPSSILTPIRSNAGATSGTVTSPTATPKPVATATPKPAATATPKPGATATPVPSSGGQVLSFTSSGGNNSNFTVVGSVSNSKGTVSYEGKSLSYCLKMESATKITFTTTSTQTLTLVFGGTTSASGKRVVIDGTTYTTTASGSNYIVTKSLSAGTHTITKADSINLFYVSVSGSGTSTSPTATPKPAATATPKPAATATPKPAATATPVPSSTAQVLSFTSSGGNNSKFTVVGNVSNSKGTVSYDGKSLTYCLKMESATKITFTTTATQTLTLVFGGTTSASGKRVKIDGTTYTTTASGSNYIVTKSLSAGTHTITKSDSINLFYVKLQ